MQRLLSRRDPESLGTQAHEQSVVWVQTVLRRCRDLERRAELNVSFSLAIALGSLKVVKSVVYGGDPKLSSRVEGDSSGRAYGEIIVGDGEGGDELQLGTC